MDPIGIKGALVGNVAVVEVSEDNDVAIVAGADVTVDTEVVKLDGIALLREVKSAFELSTFPLVSDPRVGLVLVALGKVL